MGPTATVPDVVGPANGVISKTYHSCQVLNGILEWRARSSDGENNACQFKSVNLGFGVKADDLHIDHYIGGGSFGDVVAVRLLGRDSNPSGPLMAAKFLKVSADNNIFNEYKHDHQVMYSKMESRTNKIYDFKREATIMSKLRPHNAIIKLCGVVYEEDPVDREWIQRRGQGRTKLSQPGVSPYFLDDIPYNTLKLAKEFDEAVSKSREEVQYLRHLSSGCRRDSTCLAPPSKKEGSTYCLLLEYVQGGSLNKALQKLRQDRMHFDWGTALQMMNDVSSGMAYLHAHSIIHRDLKSANVLLTSSFGCKICDFGFSREILQDVKGDYTILGSPHWLAPEIWRLDTHYTEKVDVYSFAILLWEIICRMRPFPGTTFFYDLRSLVCVAKHRPPIPPSIPERLKDLIARAWDDEPVNRPEFSEILDELQTIKHAIMDPEKGVPKWNGAETAARSALQQSRKRLSQILKEKSYDKR